MIELGTAFGTAVVLGFAARAFGLRLGAVDRPGDELKPHRAPVPYLGGLAVAAGLAAGLAARRWPLPALVTVAVFAPIALGLVDDARHVRVPVRLVVQVGLGAVLAWGGLAATALPGDVLAYGGAIVLYAAVLNAVNMVDGMDGLAGSLTVLSAGAIGLVARGEGRAGVLALALAGAALGFLLHNLPPARLFLGDNGAYLVGAALTVAVLQAGRSVPALAGAASCLGLFLLDLVLSLMRRASGRAPLFRGDRGHLYDQLLRRGVPVPRCLAVCLGAHAVLCATGVVAARLPTAGALVLTAAVWAASLVGLVAGGFVRYRARAV